MRTFEQRKKHIPDSAPFFSPKIQTKIKTGTVGDKYEVEADQVADKVVNNKSSSGLIQSKTAEIIQQKPISETISTLQSKEMKDEEPVQKKTSEKEETIQSKCADCEKEEKVQAKEKEEEKPVQSKENGKTPELHGNTFENKLHCSKGSGKPIDKNTRQEMESGFGSDFSKINIHTDSNAVQMSQELGAQAFTNGSDIYFNKGKYDPGSKAGKHLLAHELTHTVQQTGMVQKYRDKSDMNFGLMDDAVLKEQTNNNIKARLKEIVVTLSKATVNDKFGMPTHKGTLVAKYRQNKHAEADITCDVTGGTTTDMTPAATKQTIFRMEGMGYNSSKFSGSFTPDPKNKQYTKDPKNNGSNMSFALFFKGANAIHKGPLDVGSHGCVHVGDWNIMKKLNYHCVVDSTVVTVKYV